MAIDKELIVKIEDLRGSYYQIGLKQGKELIASSILEQINQLKEMTKNSNSKIAKEIIRNVSPNLYQELEGLAAGLEMDLDSVIKLFSGYDIDFPQMGCTALVNKNYYIRNYDFSPDMYDGRIVFTNPIDGYSSVGFSQQIIGRLDGMNEKGLVVGLHFVNNKYRKEGFIATTIVRMLLEQCANIEEAIDFITNIPHGYCYNYSIMDQSGSIVVEASPQEQIINCSSPLICTNHFETEILRDKNRIQIHESVKRKKYIESIKKENLTPLSAYYHFNDENSPLFYKHYKEYFGTLHTVIYLPENLSMIVGVGGNSEPIVLSLKDYMEGKLALPQYIKGIINQAR